MSDYLSQTTFDVIWDQMLTQNVEEVDPEESMLQYGLESTDFDDDMETTPPVHVELSVSESAPLIEEVDPEEFMHQYGLESTDFDNGMETPPPVLVELSVSESAPLIEEPVTANHASPISNEQPPEIKSEFVNLSAEDVATFIEEQDNKNTLRKTLTDINKFKRFLETKGEARDIHEISVDQLDAYLANFVLSIRKSDGTEYEPSSIRNIISSVDRKLQRNRYSFLIMRGSGPEFSLTRDALKAKQKCLKKMGKGNKPKVAASLSDSEVDQMYKKNVLGDKTPTSLLNTIWWNNGVQFGIRGTTEQYNLRFESFSIGSYLNYINKNKLAN